MKDTFTFILWKEPGHEGKLYETYEEGTNGNKGRILFTVRSTATVGQTGGRNDGSVIIYNDNPYSSPAETKEAIEKNYLLRSRASGISETEFNENDQKRTEAIIEYGQQIISADNFMDEIWTEITSEKCQTYDDLVGWTCIRQ